MSKKTEALEAAGIHNSYEFYGSQPYISRYVSFGRSPIPSCWIITKRGTNLGTAWYEYGDKHMSDLAAGGGDYRKKPLAAAMAWASERFDVAEWARDPFGSYGPADFVERRLVDLGLKSNKRKP